MPHGMSVSIVDWLKTDVTAVAQERLVQLVSENEQRVRSEQAARSGGIEPSLRTMIVDGKRNASTSDITPTSRVILDWNYLVEAVIKIVGSLRLHGPELTGKWKEGIVVLVNGTEQSPDQPIPSDIEQATVAVTAPYSRRLEVGRTKSGRAFAIEVPQHYVESIAIKLRSELRDLAKFTFEYIDLAEAPQVSEAGQHRRTFRQGHAEQGSKRKGETKVRYPAIVIDEIEAIA